MFEQLINVKDDLNNAFTIAVFAHKDQTDKLGIPYILHPLRVFTKVHTKKLQIVALLHDVIEDSNVTLDNLKDYFSDDVITALDAITKRSGESYNEYLDRVLTNDLTRIVKYLDIQDNIDPLRLKQLTEAVRGRLIRKYSDALSYFLKESEWEDK